MFYEKLSNLWSMMLCGLHQKTMSPNCIICIKSQSLQAEAHLCIHLPCFRRTLRKPQVPCRQFLSGPWMNIGQWPRVNPTCLTCGEIHNWICAITACVLIESAHTLDLNFKYLEGIELLGCASLIWFRWVWSGIVSRKKKHLYWF